MQMNETNLNGLKVYLQQTLNPNAQARRSAEEFIASVETQAGYPILVLKLIESSVAPNELAIRQAAAVLFKNYVTKYWDPEREDTKKFITIADRNIIKTHIVDLMCSAPDQIQRQLSAALSTIGDYDFPHHWENLLPELVSKFHSDWTIVNGVLVTASTIFKRFRNVFKSDDLYRELKHCLENFQQPLLELYKYAGTQLVTCGNDKNQMIQILNALRTMSRIFYSLNWQDLPAFFEDHMQEWMQEFQKYLKYENPLLLDADETDEPNAIDTVQGAIVENLNLYAEKYEEEFQPYLQGFTEIIWSLLSHKITIHPKHDMLAATCMKFLKAVSSQPMNKALFQEKAILTEICSNIVVRNLQLRESDEDLFEDNPMDYIRRDIEGSDGDTRRSAARELVRGLLRNYHEAVTEICLGVVTTMLQQYTADPVNQWRLKDVSINLIIALAVQKQSKANGVSELNPNVPVMEFFTTHIIPELADPNSSVKLLKADAIKFVSTFRSQLTIDMMNQLVPMLVRLLLPEHFVVHTYAASCIERILTVKDVSPTGANQLRFGRASLSPYLAHILQGIFGILEQPNYPENDYLMKSVMRVMNVAKEDIVPVTDIAVSKLTNILKKICANPSNPIFSHYLFESISVLVLNVCKLNPAATEQFETLLFPPFQSVLSADVDALCPYVYQVLAQLLELRPQGVSSAYMSMFPILLTPSLWERVSNVTALVKLIEAYIHKAPEQMTTQYIQGILGVFQKLLSSRTTENSGLGLIRAFFCYMPVNNYASLAPEIFKLIMLRLQSRLSGRMGIVYVKDMLYSLSVFVAKHGPIPLLESVERLQSGMGSMLLQQVWLANVSKVRGGIERKTCVIALARILVEAPLVVSDKALWGPLLAVTLSLLEESEEKTVALVDDDEALLELEETGYDAGFAKLHFASLSAQDYLDDIPAAGEYLVKSLSKLSASKPGVYPSIAQQALSPKTLATLDGYFKQAQVSFQ